MNKTQVVVRKSTNSGETKFTGCGPPAKSTMSDCVSLFAKNSVVATAPSILQWRRSKKCVGSLSMSCISINKQTVLLSANRSKRLLNCCSRLSLGMSGGGSSGVQSITSFRPRSAHARRKRSNHWVVHPCSFAALHLNRSYCPSVRSFSSFKVITGYAAVLPNLDISRCVTLTGLIFSS